MALLPTAPNASTAAPVLHTAVLASRRLLVGATAAALLVAALPLHAPAADGFALACAALGLVIGLPHGAVDHLLAARMSRRPAVVAASVYGAVALAAWAALLLWGPIALTAVLALSVVHFALGEWEVVAAETGWTPSRPIAAAVALAGTGALLLPLARVGDPLREVADAVCPGLGDLLAAEPVRLAVAALWACAAAVAAVAAARDRQGAVLVDLAVIALAGALLPPLMAFGLWFGCWHGLRHLGRLLTLEPGCALLVAAGDGRGAVRRLAAVAALPTVAAAGVTAVLVAVTITDPDPTAALGGSLIVLLALTVPHMLVVLGIDLGRWRSTSPRASTGPLRPR